MSKNDEKRAIRCSFCGKHQDQVAKIIAGPGAYICNECVHLCMDILENMTPPEGQMIDPDMPDTIPTPREIKAYLDEYVIGQDTAKVALSVAVYNHYKRIYFGGGDDVELQKSNILLIGPTGSGKTLLAQTLAKILNVPFAIADATTLTEAGYVGDDVENILLRLVQAADYDIEQAERGIIYIDEMDKIARKSENTSITRDVSGEGVQQALLKILEGTVASVPVEGSRKHREMETVQIDTRDILFICGGAFVGLADIVAQRLGARESGFGAAWHEREVPKRELLAQASADDLADFGLLPEFIGRLPVVSVLEELTEDDLARILVEPENALVKQYQKLFAIDGVTLTFTEDAVRQIAATSIRRGTGARGLRSIIEKTLEDTMFQLPSMTGVSEVVVDEASVNGSGTPKLLKVSTEEIPRRRTA